MNAFFLGYLFVLGGTTLVCLIGASWARTVSDPDTRVGLVALLLASGGWSGTYLGVFLAPTAGLAHGFHIAGLVIGAAAVGAWLWFCSAYAGRDLHRDRSVQRWAFIVFALVVITKLTNPWHGLYFAAEPVELPFHHLALDYHLLYWGSAGLAYALAAVGYFMLYDLFRNVASRGGALGPLAALMALPIVFNAFGYVRPSLLEISHEPIGVAAFAVGVFFLYRKEFRAVRFAGTQKDPAFVVDQSGIVREHNRSAQALLPEQARSEGAIGRSIEELFPEMSTALEKRDTNIRIGEGPTARYYRTVRHGRVEAPDTGRSGADHFLQLTDVTEQVLREEALKEERDALHRLSRVAIDPEASLEDKMTRLIELGREYLGLPYGFLTEISEDTQKIVYASGDHPHLQAGSTYPLSQTYCRQTIREKNLFAISDSPAAGWEEDPAYRAFKLGAYIGAKVKPDGTLYGTFCFADSEPRAVSFSAREKAFLGLLAHWASYEIGRDKDKRRLERQNERLKQFAGVLTHDLRNPLNIAQGRLSLAFEETPKTNGTDTSAPEGAEETALVGHLQATGRALGRMERLIADMLALTWSDQELRDESLKEVSLGDVSQRSWEQVEAPEARLRAEHDIQVRAHGERLQQFLENLFRNAVEHGGEAVTVTVGALPEENSPTGFFVEDDGPGIPEEKREKVFERGYSSEEEGTGLGLSIAQSIAEAHGWALSVTQGPEGGARFEVRKVETGT